MKKITYLIPVYNEIRTLKKAINDVINLKYSIKINHLIFAYIIDKAELAKFLFFYSKYW